MKKRFLAVALGLTLLSSTLFTGCAKMNSIIGKKDSIEGEWECTIDMVDTLNDQFEEAGMGGYFDIDNFKITMQLEFDDDGNYSMTVDEDALKDTMDDVIDSMTTGLEDMLADLAEENGMTFDDLMSAMGYESMSDYMEEAFSEDTFNDMVTTMETEGKYKVEDDKLFMTTSKEEDFSDDEYDIFELDGDELKFTERVGSDEEDDMSMYYPITFERID